MSDHFDIGQPPQDPFGLIGYQVNEEPVLALLADPKQPLRRILIGLRQGQGRGAIQAVCADRVLVGGREPKHIQVRRHFFDWAIPFHLFTFIGKHAEMIAQRGYGNARLRQSAASAVRPR